MKNIEFICYHPTSLLWYRVALDYLNPFLSIITVSSVKVLPLNLTMLCLLYELDRLILTHVKLRQRQGSYFQVIVHRHTNVTSFWFNFGDVGIIHLGNLQFCKTQRMHL